jgi:hypothetical protein
MHTLLPLTFLTTLRIPAWGVKNQNCAGPKGAPRERRRFPGKKGHFIAVAWGTSRAKTRSRKRRLMGLQACCHVSIAEAWLGDHVTRERRIRFDLRAEIADVDTESVVVLWNRLAPHAA